MRGSVALPPVKRAQLRYASSNKETPVILLSQLLTNNRTTLCSTPARIEVIAVYALNYLKLQFLSTNMIALIGTVLYNAIKEYYDNRTRKIIYFYSYTIENNYNAICKKWKKLSEIHDYHDNNVNNILIKYYNCAGKREDNIFTIDKCRTGYSNKEDIEANEREKETRVRLRELSEKIYNILLREFRGANDFTESITYNDDEQELELEDCNALVERYKEEINCSDLYSTM
ncbi:hypothetical protein HBI83_247720 [Parastagonospora nodorum]|nr:hypothetical protein HBI83_247720 [Parastagonospora nodorum]